MTHKSRCRQQLFFMRARRCFSSCRTRYPGRHFPVRDGEFLHLPGVDRRTDVRRRVEYAGSIGRSRDRTNLCVIWDLSRSKIYSVGHNRGTARDSRRRILPGDRCRYNAAPAAAQSAPKLSTPRRVATTKSPNSFHGRGAAAAGVRHRLLARNGHSAHEMGQHHLQRSPESCRMYLIPIDLSCIMCEDLAQDGRRSMALLLATRGSSRFGAIKAGASPCWFQNMAQSLLRSSHFRCVDASGRGGLCMRLCAAVLH